MPAISPSTSAAASLAAYIQLLRRRKWVILAALLITPAIAYVVTSREAVRYQASTQVLLLSPATNTAAATGGLAQPLIPNTIDTQTTLARSRAVATLAVSLGKLGMSPDAFLAETAIGFSPSGDIATFVATTPGPTSAPQLANAYAAAYVRYRYTSETQGLDAIAKTLEARLAATPPGAGRAALSQQLQAVEAQQAVHVADARVIQSAEGASAVRPPTRRNIVLGLALGLVLGLGLAFLLDALDTRVRSTDVVEERLGLPLLARLPAPARELQQANALAMIEEPTGPAAEAFRMLRTNVEFAMLDRDIRTVMITSAVEEEGKSTTIANLAVAFARMGRPVTLIDLDLRRPMLHRFFDLGGRPGLTEVVLGKATLQEALAPFDPGAEENGHPDGSANGNGWLADGRGGAPLKVLGLGITPPNPGEFVASRPLASLFETLRETTNDLILIDTPPLFHVGDSLTLSAKVDAVILASKMDVARRPDLSRLRRLVEAMPAHPLGVAVTGVSFEDAYYGYGAYYYSRRPAPELAGR